MHGKSEPGKLNHRDDLFDAVKGVGIFFVVTGHLLSGTSIIQEFIAACHMPAFFFVSGYFFIGSYKKYSTGAFVQKKVKTLLIPYIFWSSVSFLMNGIPYFIYRDLSGLFTAFEEIFMNARSVWFLIILFFTELFCYITKKCAQQIKCSWYMFGVACWILFDYMIIKSGCWRIISIYKFEWLLPYFLLGSVCRETGILDKFQKRKMHVWSVFLWGGGISDHPNRVLWPGKCI